MDLLVVSILLQHSFGVHSVEPSFRLVCGINGCMHCFTYGSTFSSFKSHASRKHPNWKERINEAECSVHLTPLSCTDMLSDREQNCNEWRGTGGAYGLWRYISRKLPSAQRTAALFFQEKHRVSQTAINFAIGSISTIVDSVCTSIERFGRFCYRSL